ncbi:MAG: hypothetical protein KGY99_03690 [Phycisphaerae bacterium]|nr:hypothetical protein [Phycisphaerae bacterium]
MNDTSQEQPTIAAGSETPRKITCPATKDPAVRLFIGAAMMIGFGVWCWTDLGSFPKPDVPFSIKSINPWSGYLFNHIGAYVLLPLGLVPLLWGIVFLRRRLVADEEGVGYAGREKIAWRQIETVDATKLKDKGILVLHAGKRKLKLDSWKLQNFKELVAFVETHAPDAARKTD